MNPQVEPLNVVRHSLKNDVILDVTIDGVRYQALAGETPYVQLTCKYGAVQSCEVGVSSINKALPINVSNGPGQWMVCKYETQGRVDLEDLTPRGRELFSELFGIPFGDRDYKFFFRFRGLQRPY